MKELFTGILVKHDKYGRKYAGKGRFVILQESIRKVWKKGAAFPALMLLIQQSAFFTLSI